MKRSAHGENISLRFGGELLDIAPVQRNWRLGTIEQDPEAAVNATDPNNGASLFGKAWTARSAERTHPESSPDRNGLNGRVIVAPVRISGFAALIVPWRGIT
jgi:hypothetical protein